MSEVNPQGMLLFWKGPLQVDLHVQTVIKSTLHRAPEGIDKGVFFVLKDFLVIIDVSSSRTELLKRHADMNT